MTREEHLKRCKERALQYVEQGNCLDALNSMAADLTKHPETANHHGLELGMMLMMSGNLSTPQEMKKFIEGFN